MPITQDVLFQAELSTDLNRKLQAMAEEDHRSKAGLFRWLIEQEWDRRTLRPASVAAYPAAPTPPAAQ